MPHIRRNFGDSGYAWIDEASCHNIAVVFVHGWWGDYQETWIRQPPRLERLKFWQTKQEIPSLLELLANDSDLTCDYYSFAHSAGPFSATLVQTVASSLRASLELLSKEQHIILVAHSLGGVVCRWAIIEALNGESHIVPRILGLLMYGTPNNGTELAKAAGNFLGSASANQLKPLNEWLAALNTAWLEHVINGGNPNQDLKRRLALRLASVVGEQDKIVPPASASALSQIGQVKVLGLKDHRSLTKATNAEDPSYTILKDFLKACMEDLVRAPLVQGIALLQDRLRRSMSGSPDWCFEEEERITVQRPNGTVPVVSQGSLSNNVVSCKLRGIRKGYPAKSTFLLGVRLEDRPRPSDERKLDYDYILGRGLMEEKSYKSLVERLDKSSATKEDLEKLVRVVSVSVMDVRKAESIEYSFEGLDSGAGYAVMTFKAGKPDIESVGRRGELRFVFETTVLLEQGWYTYYCARPIIQKLHVELTAPCRLIPITSCDSCQVEKNTVPGSNDDFTSIVEVKGPIPEGAFITWLFAS